MMTMMRRWGTKKKTTNDAETCQAKEASAFTFHLHFFTDLKGHMLLVIRHLLLLAASAKHSYIYTCMPAKFSFHRTMLNTDDISFLQNLAMQVSILPVQDL